LTTDSLDSFFFFFFIEWNNLHFAMIPPLLLGVSRPWVASAPATIAVRKSTAANYVMVVATKFSDDYPAICESCSFSLAKNKNKSSAANAPTLSSLQDVVT
jgi:hypothetical protein